MSLLSPSPSPSPPTLEALCMGEYLKMLQDFAATLVRIARHPSPLFRSLFDNSLAVMRGHLNKHLVCGSPSSHLRQAMIERILRSGDFPAARYKCTYANPLERARAEGIQFNMTDTLRQMLNEVRASSVKCSSVCCSGFFIVETMICVLLNEDVKRIVFNFRPNDPRGGLHFPHKLIGRFVALQVPAMLAHYTQAVRDATSGAGADAKPPQLERLVVCDTQIPSREYAVKHHHLDVMDAYAETEAYINIPYKLSAAAYGRPFGATSEHLMLSLNDLFRASAIGYERLTEIVLGREAVNTNLRIKTSERRQAAPSLFRNIGHSCPNLKVLDLSGALNVSAECLLQLFFHDAYQVLHQYVYMPEWIQLPHSIVQNDECDLDKIRRHDHGQYCPWCPDKWTLNDVRCELEFSDTLTPLVDDRVFRAVEDNYPEKAKKYLINVIKASDLVKSIGTQMKTLRRQPGPFPTRSDFKEPANHRYIPDVERGLGFYEPLPEATEYCVDDSCQPIQERMLNPLVKTLQCLRLGSDNIFPKHEIVPFLLAVCPQIRSLGSLNVVRGLKMIGSIPDLAGIKAANLEEAHFSFFTSNAEPINSAWAGREIEGVVEAVGSKLWGSRRPNLEETRELLRDDVATLAGHCPNLKKLELFLFGESHYVFVDDDQLWAAMDKLRSLRDVHYWSHVWSEAVAFLRVMGARLTKYKLTLDGRFEPDDAQEDSAAANANWQKFVPKLEQVLELCPNLEDLSLSFGLMAIEVSTSPAVEPDPEDDPPCLRRLSKLQVYQRMTKRAFFYLWARMTNIRDLWISTLVDAPADHFTFSPAEFDYDDVLELTRSNKMDQLKQFNVFLNLKSICCAQLLIEAMPGAESIRRLVIQVGRPFGEDADQQGNVADQLAELNREIRNMTAFAKFVREREKSHGVNIEYGWDKLGLLGSIDLDEQGVQ